MGSAILTTDWSGTRAGQERLRHDEGLLAEHHPTIRLSVSSAGVVGHGRLVFQVGAADLARAEAIRVVFPGDYPKTEPSIYSTARRDRHVGDRHFYADGRCCLWLDVESRWRPDDPNALLALVDEASIFFVRQWLYDMGHGWTGGEHLHGGAAYVRHLEDRGVPRDRQADLLPAILGRLPEHAACPCGSGRVYFACHQDTVRHLLARAAPGALLEYVKLVRASDVATQLLAGGWRWALPCPR